MMTHQLCLHFYMDASIVTKGNTSVSEAMELLLEVCPLTSCLA